MLKYSYKRRNSNHAEKKYTDTGNRHTIWSHKSQQNSMVRFANRKIYIFIKRTCKVMLCVGVGLIKKTSTWQQISWIPCSVNIKKCGQVKPFSTVAFSNLVCFGQRSFSRLASEHILSNSEAYVSSFLWYLLRQLLLLLLKKIKWKEKQVIVPEV